MVSSSSRCRPWNSSYTHVFEQGIDIAKHHVKKGARTAPASEDPYLLLLVGASSILFGIALFSGPGVSSPQFGVLAFSGVLTLVSGAVSARDFSSVEARRLERGVRSTVLLHFAVSLLLGWIFFDIVF